MELAILIIDDDKLLVKKLEETIHWEEIGISMVFTAFDIRQAQILLKEYPIQLLLCDIDMPMGSGLELLEWVREQSLTVDCIFLSSYANFAYAQKALSLTSREYLLKPISNDELEKSLKKIIRDIKNENTTKPYKTNSHNLQEFWNSFVFCEDNKTEFIENIDEKSGYSPDTSFLLVILKAYPYPETHISKKDLALFRYIVHTPAVNFLREHSLSPESIIHLRDFEKLLVFKMVTPVSHFQKVICNLNHYLKNMIPYPCYIFSSSPEKLKNLFTTQEEIEYLAKEIIPDDYEVLFQEKLSDKTRPYIEPPWQIWRREMSISENLFETETKIQQYIDDKSQKSYWTIKQLRRFLQEFLQLLYEYMNEKSLRFSNLFEMDSFAVSEQYAYISLNGFRNLIHLVFETLKGNQDHKEQVVEWLKDYINTHLSDDLSRKELAKKVYLSEAYLSKKFAKETNVSLSAYVTARRMEYAKKLLASSSLTVSQIALEVGYHNFSYFSKSFRDATGCSPNEYRSILNRNSLSSLEIPKSIV